VSDASTAEQRLLTILAAEERLYGEMRGLLQEERHYFAALEVAEIERVVRRKEALAEEARFLDESRRELVRELADELGLNVEDPSLGTLCDAMGDGATEVAAMHARLKALIGAVRELVVESQGVAGEALFRVQALLKLFSRLAPEVPTYGPLTQPSQARASAGRIVSHAV
jgi:hypothetical protein